MPSPNQFQVTDQTGLIVAYFGNSVAVEAANGQIFQCYLRRNQPLPVVGDEVLWRQDALSGQTGTLIAIKPRQSTLARGDQRGQMKIIAANIDVMVIVMVPPPIFSDYLVDRYLTAAAILGIKPLLVLNKIDLLTDETREETLSLLAPYRALTDDIICTSVVSQAGLQALSDYLQQQTAVLVGPSGVGKSSIIAALSQDHEIKIAATSTKGTGKHTTTATRLYHLPTGGRLIDSPGVREFNLWPVDQETLLKGFKDVAAFFGQCQFRDCQHTKEPGCGLQMAIETGKLARSRFVTYQTLLKEMHAKPK